MKLESRKLKSYRKNKPMKHRSFAEKRGRLEKHIKIEVESYLKR